MKMKKTIVSLAIAALSLSTFSVMAQNNTNVNDNSVKKECVKGDKKCDKDGKMGKGPRAGKDMKAKKNPFEGINLSEAQKTKLQELDNKQKEARMAKKEEMKAQKQEMKAQKLANDSVKKAERKAAKKAYLEEVKAIIGPENYVIFLENVYLNGGDKPRGDKMAFRNGDKAKGMNADKAKCDKNKKGDKAKRDGKRDGKRNAKRGGNNLTASK